MILFALVATLLALVAWWQRHSPEGQRVAVTVVALVAAAPSPAAQERVANLCAHGNNLFGGLLAASAFCRLDDTTRTLVGLLAIGAAFNADLDATEARGRPTES